MCNTTATTVFAALPVLPSSVIFFTERNHQPIKGDRLPYQDNKQHPSSIRHQSNLGARHINQNEKPTERTSISANRRRPRRVLRTPAPWFTLLRRLACLRRKKHAPPPPMRTRGRLKSTSASRPTLLTNNTTRYRVIPNQTRQDNNSTNLKKAARSLPLT